MSTKKRKTTLGSQTARAGFQNEDEIIIKFNNWESDPDAQEWLSIMGYPLKEIEEVFALKITGGFKTDVQVQVTVKLKKAIDAQNIQIKLTSNKKGFNQIDKRYADKYGELWNIPNTILSILKHYSGEFPPKIKKKVDERRMFMFEFSESEQSAVKNWLERNKTLIINDILKGRGKFASEWILVARKFKDPALNNLWVLKPINIAINHFSQGPVLFTKRGNIKLGRITLQRKGGDGGRPTANMLQFKLNPNELFGI